MTEIEAAARKEGKLVVYAAAGHADREAQTAMGKLFRERYGVTIEWTTMNAQDIVPRVLAEQRTRQYIADITMSGIAGHYTELKPRGYVAPILAPSTFEKGVWRLEPAVLFPDTRDWLYLNMPLNPTFFINTQLLSPPQEPRSYKDLLSSNWKGRIVIQDPSKGGRGSGWFRAVYKELGLDYMKALAKQVVIVANTNDSVDAVARGQYPLAVAPATNRGRQLIHEGAPVKFSHPAEGSHITTNGICLIANGPHPNAAKVFVNWFFGKEGQMIYAPNQNAISVRRDVPQDYLAPGERYEEGQRFFAADAADQTPPRPEELLKLARETFIDGK
jgi:iron(III) transport system substrate-binding protein